MTAAIPFVVFGALATGFLIGWATCALCFAAKTGDRPRVIDHEDQTVVYLADRRRQLALVTDAIGDVEEIQWPPYAPSGDPEFAPLGPVA